MRTILTILLCLAITISVTAKQVHQKESIELSEKKEESKNKDPDYYKKIYRMFFSSSPEEDKDAAYSFDEKTGSIHLKQNYLDKMSKKADADFAKQHK